MASLRLLRSAYIGVPARGLAEPLAVLARAYSGCEAVAIRLKEGPDFPYAAHLGFDPEFIAQETRLCALCEEGSVVRDGGLNPVLECLCGAVLSGGALGSCATAAGSFIAQSAGDLEGPEVAAQPRLRNRCPRDGFRSIALVPIRQGARVFGLIQCNDRREGRFPPERVELLEALAAAAGHLLDLSTF